MVQSSDEHSTACLGNKSWRLPVIWKCIWNSLSVYEYLQNVLVYGHIWYIWIVVIISEYWDWNWTCMKTNEKILTWLQAIEIHSDVTPSYALGCAFRRNSGGFRRNSDTRHRPFRFRTGSAGMCYNTILDIPIYSGWYLSTRFLQVENACNYSK
jgi:hypothetical protein